MKKTKFTYKGLEFEPLGDLGKNKTFDKIMRETFSLSFSPPDWNYEEFYRVAKENDCDVDLFICNGIVVIPVTNYLFGYEKRKLSKKLRSLIK